MTVIDKEVKVGTNYLSHPKFHIDYVLLVEESGFYLSSTFFKNLYTYYSAIYPLL